MAENFVSEDVKRVMLKLTMRMQETEASITNKPLLETAPNENEFVHIEESQEDPISPSKSKTMTAKEFANSTLARMSETKQKSMQKLKDIEEVNKKKELSELKKKPEISKASQKLGKRDEKVYERYEKDAKERLKALERIKEKLEKERNDKINVELTFTPKLIKPNKTKARTKEEFFNYNMQWVERMKKKKELKKSEIEEKLKVDLKFTPGLDNNSVTIVQSQGVRKPIEERLLEKSEFNKRKLQALREEQAFSFIPVIEENSRTMAKGKGQVFDRLFKSKRDSTPTHKSTKTEPKQNRSFSFSNDLEDDPQAKLDFLFDVSS